jgi:Zn-finger nucleic acid-binding protein
MRNYERNQVMVDQCPGCGGLFLDRGELERLYSAESAFYDGPGRSDATPSEPNPGQPRYEDHRRPKYEDHRRPKSKKKKAKSFLEEFFE